MAGHPKRFGDAGHVGGEAALQMLPFFGAHDVKRRAARRPRLPE